MAVLGKAGGGSGNTPRSRSRGGQCTTGLSGSATTAVQSMSPSSASSTSPTTALVHARAGREVGWGGRRAGRARSTRGWRGVAGLQRVVSQGRSEGGRVLGGGGGGRGRGGCEGGGGGGGGLSGGGSEGPGRTCCRLAQCTARGPPAEPEGAQGQAGSWRPASRLACSTPDEVEKTRSWHSSRMTFVV